MQVLHVTEQGAILVRKGNRLHIYKNREKLLVVRVRQLEQIVLWGAIRITPMALRLCCEEGLDLVLVNRHGGYYGRLQGPTTKNIVLRKAQWERNQDESFSLAIGKRIIEAKIHNCRTLLRHLQRHRETTLIRETLFTLRSILLRITKAQTGEELMGLEGEAAKAYFQALGTTIHEPFFQFSKRSRRPPEDPSNALLSFGYTLLLTSIHHWVEIVGLDPFLGFLHRLGYGKPSLCLDLMEPFRPALVDAFIMGLISRRMIKPDDFDGPVKEGNEAPKEYRLTGNGFKKFLALWENRREDSILDPVTGKTLTWSQMLESNVRSLAKALRENEAGSFQPYRWT